MSLFVLCRVKRNTVEYDRIGATSDGEVTEFIEFVEELRSDVLVWLKKNHPALCAEHILRLRGCFVGVGERVGLIG